jgi:hypothetical protein
MSAAASERSFQTCFTTFIVLFFKTCFFTHSLCLCLELCTTATARRVLASPTGGRTAAAAAEAALVPHALSDLYLEACALFLRLSSVGS